MDEVDLTPKKLNQLENVKDFSKSIHSPFNNSLRLNEAGFFSDLECGRESLGILSVSCLNIEADGRESLGILNTIDLNVLDTDLAPSSNELSFNSNSLNGSEISRIYCLNSSLRNTFIEKSSSEFNRAFLDNTFFKNTSSFGSLAPDLNNAFSNWNYSAIQLNPYSFTRNYRLNTRSLPDWPKEIKVPSTIEEIKGEEVETDLEFNDSVFIEAHHIASKIADGSILNDSLDEMNILDSTPQPEFADIEENHENKKCDTETIFKTVDKMLPPINKLTTQIEGTIAVNSNLEIDSQEVNVDVCENQLKLSISQTSNKSNNLKSKDTKKILQNLSEILHNENRSTEQVTEGNKLLRSLANILNSDSSGSYLKATSSTSESLEDSGHSSIQVEQSDLAENVYENTKSLKPQKELETDSNSFSNLNKILDTQTIKSNKQEACESNNIKDKMNNDLPSLLKLKTKTKDRFASMKGPLKAMLPLGKLSKKVNVSPAHITPVELKSNSLFSFKKTSTPYEPKHKPVAQSTPETKRSPSGIPGFINRSRREGCPPTSPLARSSNESIKGRMQSENGSINQSDSLPNISDSTGSVKNTAPNNAIIRRKSASDLKYSNTNNYLKRSYSIGKKSDAIQPVIGGKEMVAKKKVNNKHILSSKSTDIEDETQNRSKLGERNRSFKSSLKPFNLAAKLKKSGKENTGH